VAKGLEKQWFEMSSILLKTMRGACEIPNFDYRRLMREKGFRRGFACISILLLSLAFILPGFFGVADSAGNSGASESDCIDKTRPRVCFTFDDPNSYRTPSLDWRERNRRILEALKKNDLQAALFVCGKRVDNGPGRIILERWDRSGHLICNHTYSHINYNSPKVVFEDFRKDFLRCDALIGEYAHYKRLFRFPYLKEGDTVTKRDAFREELKQRGYGPGHVTIDASDWYIDGRLKTRLELNPAAATTPYRDFYLKHILERAEYYRNLAQETLGREVPHSLLIHHNLLNALFLGDLIEMFQRQGWETIDASLAFQDSVYLRFADTLPAGESIIWALAGESDEFESRLRYPAEDGVYEKEEMDRLGL